MSDKPIAIDKAEGVILFSFFFDKSCPLHNKIKLYELFYKAILHLT